MSQRDIVAELEVLREQGIQNVADHVHAQDVLARAIAEIKNLRSLAGAVSQGDGDFRSIARDLPRNEPKATGT